MKAAYFVKKGLVEAREVEDATVEQDTDAVIRIIRACVCGVRPVVVQRHF